MKLRLFFIFVILYVIAAFGWLAFSLIDSSNAIYKTNRELLEAGKYACILNVIQKGKNNEFISADTQTIYLQEIEMEADSNRIREFLRYYNSGTYKPIFTFKEGKINLGIDISKTVLNRLEIERVRKVRLHIFQAVLLSLLVGIGVYGVYYSVQIIYRLNKQQNNFLLSVTHELKTPIAAMKLLLQTIRVRELPREKQNELIDKAVANSDRLNELTENMLTAMQIENDKYNYGKEPFSVTEMIEKLVESYSLRAEIEAQIEEGIEMEGDRFVIRISLNNLLENAIKYGKDNPIFVGLTFKKNKAIIEIKDHGIGIPEAEKKKIFKKFYRVEDEETRDTKGTGLGLFIVKETIEKHKGSIVVSDNHPKGTIFTIVVPAKKMSSP
ncbi:MAG: HAMP domain-containing histidine kinase [Flavobacteriales bacterium]|nr:HAMP domain-containing histidine kinase [Flavobacteriales bacterium]